MIIPAQGVVIAGRYLLVRLLGQGGMGSVWLARHRDLDIEVAVKFMAPELVASADARMRFEREARVAAPLSSHHVVQVHDCGVEDGTPYIILELLKGESLAARLATERRLTLPVASRLVNQICKGLRAAHDAGLVHRDLKPANLFLARKDDEEVLKVLDFGIAKAVDTGEVHSDTATGMMLGSAQYMSPEQIRCSRQADHRSDLWAVGVIVFRMLTGRLPFFGLTVGDVLVRVCTDTYPPPRSLAPDLPAEVDAFFARALARDPDERFQSAMELAEAFSAVALTDSAPSPPRESLPNETILMPTQVESSVSAVAARPLAGAPTAPWLTPSTPELLGATPSSSIARAPQPSATSESKVASLPVPEASPASISAMLVSRPRAESSPRVGSARERGGRTLSLSLALLSAAAVAVSLVAVFSRSNSPSQPPSGPAAMTMTSVEPPPPEIPSVTPAALPPQPSPILVPLVPTPVSGTAIVRPAPPPRVAHPPIPRPRPTRPVPAPKVVPAALPTPTPKPHGDPMDLPT